MSDTVDCLCTEQLIVVQVDLPHTSNVLTLNVDEQPDRRVHLGKMDKVELFIVNVG